jgi:protein-tyrosine phosphatase
VARRITDRIPGVQARRAARARRALADARDVLFVCKGNICRSPFAEAYLRGRLNGSPVHVHSAGYHPKRNRPCPDEALAAAKELSTDLTPHRSRILDAAMVQSADAIFTFDRENFTTVLARHPEARHKVHQLSALAGGEAQEIRDPYGGTVDEFRRAYDRIRRALDAGLASR